MEREGNQHERYVDAWLAARESPRTASRIADLLVTALDVVGTQGRGVLGDVTLEAVCGRVLKRAEVAHPCLRVFQARMIIPDDARAVLARATTAEDLEVATRLVVADLLRVLSLLTGDTLTPRLYEKLGAVGAEGGERSREKKGG